MTLQGHNTDYDEDTSIGAAVMRIGEYYDKCKPSTFLQLLMIYYLIRLNASIHEEQQR